VTIGARDGEFDGMARERQFTVRFMGKEPVDVSVSYSGEALSVTRP
jgi:hypothetical protein